MWNEYVLPTLSVLGAGTLLAIFVRYWLAKRARTYAEKRDAYEGLLDALGVPERAEDYSYWRTRIQLFGSAKVIKRVRGFEEAAAYSNEDAANAYPLLLDAMRDDLAKGPSEDLTDASFGTFGRKT